MKMGVVKNDDGYWLQLGEDIMKVSIHLGKHGSVVTAALEEAVQQGNEPEIGIHDARACPGCGDTNNWLKCNECGREW